MEESSYQATEDGGINLLDYLPVLWKYKLLIGLLCVAAVLYALISGLLAPRVYEATATLIKDAGGENVSLASLLAQQLTMGRGGTSTGRGDNILIILRSRIMAEEMARQLKLQDHYGVSRPEDAAGILRGATKIITSRDGPMAIAVEDKNPDKAAYIANSYVENLNRLMSRFGAGVASRQRIFVVERIKETEKALKEAEEVLKNFQEKNRVQVFMSQTTEAISASAALRSQLIATEVELKNLRSFATESNPEVIRLNGRIAELKRQIGQAQYGAGLDLPPMTQNPGHSQKEIYLPAAKVPQIQLEFNRLARDVKVQEGVYSALTQQLEQAKIAEAQDVPVVQLLDPALPPASPKPRKIGLQMLISGVVSAFAGVFLVLVFDYVLHNYWQTIKNLTVDSNRQ